MDLNTKAVSLDALVKAWGYDRLEPFRPGASYYESVDWLLILIEDVGYVSHPMIVHDVDILWHPYEPRVVGVKLWNMKHRPGGIDILTRMGLL